MRTGPAEIGAFFQTIFGTLEFKESIQKKFLADGDTVVVLRCTFTAWSKRTSTISNPNTCTY